MIYFFHFVDTKFSLNMHAQPYYGLSSINIYYLQIEGMKVKLSYATNNSCIKLNKYNDVT